jgi:hypothetical protein
MRLILGVKPAAGCGLGQRVVLQRGHPCQATAPHHGSTARPLQSPATVHSGRHGLRATPTAQRTTRGTAQHSTAQHSTAQHSTWQGHPRSLPCKGAKGSSSHPSPEGRTATHSMHVAHAQQIQHVISQCSQKHLEGNVRGKAWPSQPTPLHGALLGCAPDCGAGQRRVAAAAQGARHQRRGAAACSTCLSVRLPASRAAELYW